MCLCLLIFRNALQMWNFLFVFAFSLINWIFHLEWISTTVSSTWNNKEDFIILNPRNLANSGDSHMKTLKQKYGQLTWSNSMSNSHRLSIFRELGFYFRGYKIKQTGKHNREKPNTFLCGPVGICKYCVVNKSNDHL